ncbi:uroporphyrinogen-III synthase [Tropicimonas sp. S265A]|uniref:uroporphyrinogen-III synthase n=1 Tax=Tropicimonas sp. S265A TaxID=3415134 RepID=UPI003C7E6C94
MSAQHRVPVILTRAQAQSERFAKTLPDSTRAVFSPLLEMDFHRLSEAILPQETLLFTSENGVAALVAQDGGTRGQKALCVGDRTAQAARAAGFDARSARGTADDLVQMAAHAPGPFVHIHGAHTRGDVTARLIGAGKSCRALCLYTQQARPLTPEALSVLTGNTPSLVPLFSPRTAALFRAACPSAPKAHLICLSKAVSKQVTDGRYAVCKTAARPDAKALHALLCQELKAIRLETGGASG